MASTPEQMRSREEFWEHHIDRMRELKQSHKVYCEANDLNLNTMRYWTRILGRTNELKQARYENKESYWRDIHTRHLASGLTAQEFCRKESIPPSSYRFWLRRFDKETSKISPEVV